mmetsp:Transcript_21796/g.32192  ORF Transcript_21796/g.32192 Transcript_21796/m.32192 type:complete len:131 (+) Transcript_21796:231-623(+)
MQGLFAIIFLLLLQVTQGFFHQHSSLCAGFRHRCSSYHPKIMTTTRTATIDDEGEEEVRAEDMDDETELAILQNDVVWIEAIEERNKAQLESFNNEQDQWDSMTDWEQDLLTNKESHMKRIEVLTKRLEA